MECFKPMLFSCMKKYSKEQFAKDVVSGIIVAIIALPLSIALALASGVGPEPGLYTAIVAGFLISFFGGSTVQIAGPTAAFATIVAGIIATDGMDGLIIATIMAGIILIVLGLIKAGALIKFIPYTITTGFTAGIAVTILIGQFKDFFGVDFKGEKPIETIDKLKVFFSNIDTINYQAMLVGIVCLAVLIIWPKFFQKIPASIIAVFVGIAMVKGLNLKVNTIGVLYPDLKAGLPSVSVPHFSFALIKNEMPNAFTIAILAAIESLLSAVVADGMVNSKHRSNQELIGQGIGNIGSVLFGGIPATGAIARTATNIKAGGRTPVAGIFHSIFLLVFLYTAMDILAFIPMSALAAVLFMVSWGMSDLKHFTQIAKISPSDRTILFLTFALTVMVDLTVAIGVGVTFASLLFMRHMSRSVEIRKQHCKSEYETHDGEDPSDDEIEIPEDVTVLQINGPLFYGFASEFCDRLKAVEQLPRILILRMRFMPYLDASGENSIEEILNICRQHKTFVIFSAVRPQPRKILERAGLHKKLDGAIAPDFDEALKMAKKLLKDEDFIMKHIDPTKS